MNTYEKRDLLVQSLKDIRREAREALKRKGFWLHQEYFTEIEDIATQALKEAGEQE